jgi:uncharacterized Fe-S cluster protein YjdI
MKTHEYPNGEITILWKPELCIHAAVCVRTLPDVYDPKRRPWIRPENGRGLAKAMLDRLVAYAREKKVTISPLCPFVNGWFHRDPKTYEDVWNKDWHR